MHAVEPQMVFMVRLQLDGENASATILGPVSPLTPTRLWEALSANFGE